MSAGASDWISIRAGWALEELTFEDFGYRESLIDHDELLAATVAGTTQAVHRKCKSFLTMTTQQGQLH